jgi:hypothetical protein
METITNNKLLTFTELEPIKQRINVTVNKSS